MGKTLLFGAIVVVILLAAVLLIDHGGERDHPPATPEAATPAPESGRPPPTVKKRESTKGGNADLLRAIVKAAGETPPSKEAIDEKSLDERLAALRKDFEARVARIRARSRQYRKPLRGDAEPGNAWEYYRKAAERYDEMMENDLEESRVLGHVHENIPENETKEEKAERLKKAAKVIEKYRDIIDLMRKGSRQAMADDGLEYEKGIGDPRVFTSGTIGVWQFTRDAGEVLEEKKFYDEALMLYADTMRFANDAGTDHGLTGSLFGIMGNGVIGDATQQLFDRPLESESLRRFLRESTVLMEQQPTLRDSLDGEIALLEATIIDLVELPEKISHTKEQLNNILEVKRIILDGMEQYVRYIDRVQEESGAENWRGFQERVRTLQSEEASLYQHPVMRIIVPARSGSYASFYQSEAALREVHLAAAVKLYRQEHGTFPEHLDHLIATGIVPSVPVDPFTGEPFRYVRSEDGATATIYSIGENLVDNKGLDHTGGEENDDVSATIRIPTQR